MAQKGASHAGSRVLIHVPCGSARGASLLCLPCGLVYLLCQFLFFLYKIINNTHFNNYIMTVLKDKKV